MTSLDGSGRHRDALPSITNFDFEKYRLGKVDHSRQNTIPGANLPHMSMGSPSTNYSGPPPPYSSSNTIINTMSGYISPPESNSRRSTRDDKESPKGTTFLPSISEALKSADVSTPAQPHGVPSTPGSATVPSFADAAPRGPGNPFSQPLLPASAFRSSFSSNASISDPPMSKPMQSPAAPPDVMQPLLVNPLGSPRPHPSRDRPSAGSSSIVPHEASFRAPYAPEPNRPSYRFSDHHLVHPPTLPPTAAFTFEHHARKEGVQNPFAPKAESGSYGDTIKRHLDVFDAGLALKEISEASAHTLEFSKIWNQRHHQSNHTGYFDEPLPSPEEIEDIVNSTHQILANLTKIKEVSQLQQAALSEQRARAAARGHHADEDLRQMSEDFKTGAFASGDAKKRRGKAAPPGRCHSCNRAETPEWRRGPDGARTLCNACGLHYAKLSRKVGANKAAVLAGSNLRPKG